MFRKNLDRLVAIFDGAPAEVALCRTAADYRAARAGGRHAAFIGIQGGNALDGDLALESFDASRLIKVTLVHLSTSSLGTTSAPSLVFGGGSGDGALSDRGRELVRALNRHRIFVDLAHINRRGFFDAVAVHDRSQPLLVSHTGIAGVHRHWRNVDDEQLRAVADTGGVIGVMYQSSFLGEPAAAAAPSASSITSRTSSTPSAKITPRSAATGTAPSSRRATWRPASSCRSSAS